MQRAIKERTIGHVWFKSYWTSKSIERLERQNYTTTVEISRVTDAWGKLVCAKMRRNELQETQMKVLVLGNDRAIQYRLPYVWQS